MTDAPPSGPGPSETRTGTQTVVAPPPPPPASAAGEEPAVPAGPRPGVAGMLAALGSGLLGAAIAISAMRSRDEGTPVDVGRTAAEDPSTTLDWSTYAVGLGATAALLLVAIAAIVLRKGRGREELATWPGVVGILGTASMLGVGLEETDAVQDFLAYLIGAVVLALSVLGYLVVRRGAFVVTAILGLAILYFEAYGDLFDDIADDDDFAIATAAAIGVFVLVVTVVGWLLPTRALSGVLVGVVAVVSYGLLLLWLVFVRYLGDMFGAAFGTNGPDGSPGGEPVTGRAADYDNDVWTILAFAAVLTVLWALAAAVNGHPGFSVLAIAMPVATVPTGTVALAVEHPTWWGVALAGAGAVLLLVGGLRQLLSRRRSSAVA